MPGRLWLCSKAIPPSPAAALSLSLWYNVALLFLSPEKKRGYLNE
jgi:hypothetical protein